MSPKQGSKSPEESLIISSDSDMDGRQSDMNATKSLSGNDEHNISAEIRTHCVRDGPISIPTDEESETDQGQFKDTDDDLSELSDQKDSQKPKRFSTPIKKKTEKASSDSKQSFLAMPNEEGESSDSDDVGVPETLPETPETVPKIVQEVDSYENQLVKKVTDDIGKVLKTSNATSGASCNTATTNAASNDEARNLKDGTTSDVKKPVQSLKPTDGESKIDPKSLELNSKSPNSTGQSSRVSNEVSKLSEEEKRQVALSDLFNTDTESSMDTVSQESASSAPASRTSSKKNPKSMMPPPKSVMVAPRAKTPPETPPVEVMVSANGLLWNGKFHRYDIDEGSDYLKRCYWRAVNGEFPKSLSFQCAICKCKQTISDEEMFQKLLASHRSCKLESMRLISISNDKIEFRHQFRRWTPNNSVPPALPLKCEHLIGGNTIKWNVNDVDKLDWDRLKKVLFMPIHLKESSTIETRKYFECLQLDTGLNPHFRQKSVKYHCNICGKEEIIESKTDEQTWKILRQHAEIEVYFGLRIEILYNFGLPKNFAAMSFETVKSSVLSSPKMKPAALTPIKIHRLVKYIILSVINRNGMEIMSMDRKDFQAATLKCQYYISYI